MADKKDLTIVIKAVNEAQAALREAQADLGGVETKSKGLNIGLLALATSAMYMGKKMWDSSEEAIRGQNQLNAVLASTKGISGMTAQGINDIANSIMEMSNIDDDAVVAGENMLLTFTRIGKDVFPATTQAVADMATAMNNGATPGAEQMAATAMQLGKALNDPIDGVTKLTKVGVTFTEAQKKQIKTMQDAGDVMGAQKVMLAELATEFGGSAAANANALGLLQNKIMNLSDELMGKLRPYIIATAEALSKFLDKAVQFVRDNQETIKTVLAMVGAFISVIAVVEASIKVWGMLVQAFKFVQMAMTALMANPIVLLLALIAAGVAYLSIKFGGLQNAFAVIGAGLVILANVIIGGLKTMGNAVIGFINGALDVGNKVYNWFSGMLAKVGVDIGTADLSVKFQFDTTANDNAINEMGAMVQGLADQKIAEDNRSSASVSANLAKWPPEVKEATGKASSEMTKFGDKVKSTMQSAADSLNEVGNKIVEITQKISDLNTQYAKDNLGIKQDYASAYVEQEQKVSDLAKEFADKKVEYNTKMNESVDSDNIASHNNEMAKLQADYDATKATYEKEKTALDERKTIEIAYQNEVAEARRRASMTEFQRTIEDLNQKKMALDQEFESKAMGLAKELTVEVAKYNEIRKYQDQAFKNYQAYLANNEKATADSINAEILKWNALAEAINRAKAGKTSSVISTSALNAKVAEANQGVGSVTINISGNTLLDGQAAEKLGNQIISKLKLSNALSN